MFLALPILIAFLGAGVRCLAFRYGDRDPIWWAASTVGTIAAAVLLAVSCGHYITDHKGSDAYSDCLVMLVVGAAAVFLAVRDWHSYGAYRSGQLEQAGWPQARPPAAKKYSEEE